jgi:ParB/RepB/Spo0J family partition protein
MMSTVPTQESRTAAAAQPSKGAALIPVGMFNTVPVDSLVPSTTNPRKAFGQDALDELAKSIREHGIVEPLIVRPRDAKGKGYEIVAGERRWRAAQLAALEEVPVIVRELTDKQSLEIQVIENLQRQDLHELEEADGYQQLHEKYGYSIDELAAKVAKSKGHIYARLKLGELGESGRKHFLTGKINASVALLLARIPVPELQDKAAGEVARTAGGSPMSYRDAFDHIQREYMLRLSDGGFSTTDPDLVPSAGPCSTCPKRTGNQRELFADVKSADVCTDPVCFRTKREAAFARAAAAAEASGHKVIAPSASKKLFDRYAYAGGGLSHEGAQQYVTLDQNCPQDGKRRNYGAVLGKRASEHLVLAQNPSTGELVKLIPKASLPKLLKDAGVKRPAPAATSSADKKWREEQKKARAVREIAGAVRLAALADVAAAAEKRELGDKELRFLASVFLVEVNNAGGEIADGLLHAIAVRRGLAKPDAKGKHVYQLEHAAEKVLRTNLPKMAGRDLRGFLMELVVASLPERGYDGGPSYSEGFAFFGIDLKELAKKAAAPAIAKCRECGCTEDNACDVMGEGCAWLEKPDPKTGLGLCSAPRCAAKRKGAKKARK